MNELNKITGKKERLFPMNKPEGHVPVIQLYSRMFPDNVTEIQNVYFGIQSKSHDRGVCLEYLQHVSNLLSVSDEPVHFDFAQFTDDSGYLTMFVVA